MSTFNFLMQCSFGFVLSVLPSAVFEAAFEVITGKSAKSIPWWSKEESDLQVLKRQLCAAALIAIHLHDVLLENRSLYGKQPFNDELILLSNNVNLVSAMFWGCNFPMWRLLYVLFPRVIAFYF